MSDNKKAFPLRVSSDLFEEIKEWASQEMRSVNGQIEFLLRQAVNKRKRREDEPPSQADSQADRKR